MRTNFRPVGYLLQNRLDEPPVGEPGHGYNYVLANNGLFIKAENRLIEATVQVAPANVRGLAPIQGEFRLTNGPIPMQLLQHILRAMRQAAPNELFAAITWKDEIGYRTRIPPQDASKSHVSYEATPDTVLEAHSHGNGRAFFSSQDDADEQGLRLYGVIGRSGSSILEVAFRVGVYGNFQPASANSIFSPGA